MCGIIAYIGLGEAQPIILKGLKKLAYRGYDSAGLAILQENGHVAMHREVGKLEALEAIANNQPLAGSVGIGHTRWATHGSPSVKNAHPHTGSNSQVALAHNGILENYLVLKDELRALGIEFQSETDTEVIVQLIEYYIAEGASFETAVRRTLSRLEGSNAIVALSKTDPEKIIGARLGYAGGITLGIGKGEMYISSDIPAIMDYTDLVAYLDNGQVATITAEGYSVSSLAGDEIVVHTERVPWEASTAAKGKFRHYMLKEIHEQPQAVINTISNRVDFERGEISIPDINMNSQSAASINRIYIVACGSSYYAGLVGKYLIENIARIPVEVVYGSEFRYSDPIIDSRTAVLAITQSGETADTLAAFELAANRGATLWSIVNVLGSQAMRMADGHITMQAGTEIGVATTKAFVASLVDLYLLACLLGKLRGNLSRKSQRQYIRDLLFLPSLIGQVINDSKTYSEIADLFFHFENFLFIGRGINYPIALEGALKLKEISYIHAEGYPAGEMKHGPISLIDNDLPILAIATKDLYYDKMISQMEQARSRGGTIIALASEGDTVILNLADYILTVPITPPYLSPIINIIPLQFLAYFIASKRNCDIDQPRNLAKSVTVE
jgi:glucosamine--fructose-6-phosphate aminotransferase (isomerizing)